MRISQQGNKPRVNKSIDSSRSLNFSVPASSSKSLNEILVEILRVCARGKIGCRVIGGGGVARGGGEALPSGGQAKGTAAVVDCTSRGVRFQLRVVQVAPSVAARNSTGISVHGVSHEVVTHRMRGDRSEYETICRRLLPQLALD